MDKTAANKEDNWGNGYTDGIDFQGTMGVVLSGLLLANLVGEEWGMAGAGFSVGFGLTR